MAQPFDNSRSDGAIRRRPAPLRLALGLGLLVLGVLPSVAQEPPQPGSLGFFTVSPCRVVDTRLADGPWGGPAISANTSRSFTIAGRCGIPSSVDAVSVIVTAVQPPTDGGLRLYAGGTPLPGANALMFRAGKTRANNGGFGLGFGGALGVHADMAAGAVHVVIDVNGYYETGAATPPPPTPTPTPSATPPPTATPTPPPPPPGSGSHIWSKDFGGPGGLDTVMALGIATDSQGEISMVGALKNKGDVGTGLLTSAGEGDILIAHYDAAGTPKWVKLLGSSMDDRAKAVAVDAAGNVYVTGLFRGTIDFGGGPISTTNFAGAAFLVKYNSDGGHVWSKRLNAGTGLDEGTALAVDASGNVFVGGILYQTSDFGSGPLTSAGGADIFLAKYSSSGAFGWVRRMGASGEDWVYGVAVNGNGGPAIAGSFVGSVDFGGGALNSRGGKDIVVAHYSSTGGHIWSRAVGGSADDVCRGIAVDGAGYSVVTGNFASSSIDFGAGSLANAGGADIFLARYDGGGSAQWSKRWGSTLSLAENAFSVATDIWGNVLLTGSLVTNIDFGGGSLAGDGYYDIFLAKFNAGGGHVWSKRTGAGEGTDILADALGNVIVTGDFSGATTVNFGGQNLLSPGGTDTFLVKLTP